MQNISMTQSLPLWVPNKLFLASSDAMQIISLTNGAKNKETSNEKLLEQFHFRKSEGSQHFHKSAGSMLGEVVEKKYPNRPLNQHDAL